MLAAACAVGVSSCFGSPIGGTYMLQDKIKFGVKFFNLG